ncbi:NrdI family protein [Lactiplantibacillus plantarum 4_3]|uniref:class Ib ribonucleoside-diphosphate reductase assembly flavoprotein NrdI n=1 Tax=Lactiplantibacillus plantarum TaxID=1590 RepID=UPI0003D3B675|nr:class Ib ribonucleoside-diphosphate reductase assembly flavoprotein NrdI [Lactiplantibacillus plantarum]ETF12656.1 NrdI family protein [Lactiplantibacillus plantarum 4_3]
MVVAIIVDINIFYISLSGNTRDFISRLSKHYASKNIKVSALNVKEHPEYKRIEDPFVAFLPAFLKGGNGTDNGFSEILTTRFGDYLAYDNNYRNCYGIVGSGNRNFNKQFALTAKQYSKRFGFPMIDEFELRGTDSDIQRIAQKILMARKEFQK